MPWTRIDSMIGRERFHNPRHGWAGPPRLSESPTPDALREALDALRAEFPVDDVSPGPWVVEQGSIAWKVREGPGGPQIGNFILEADARFAAAARAALATTPESDR